MTEYSYSVIFLEVNMKNIRIPSIWDSNPYSPLPLSFIFCTPQTDLTVGWLLC